MTGKPLVGPGDLLIAAGGDAYSNLASYLNRARTTAVYTTEYDLRRSSDNSLVKKVSDITETHDFVLIQVVQEPDNGTLILLAYGFDAAGTTAAGWYFANVMLPSLTNYTKSWYLYEWSDAPAVNAPTTAAEFQLIDSGT